MKVMKTEEVKKEEVMKVMKTEEVMKALKTKEAA